MDYDRKELVDWIRGIYQNLDDADKQDALRFFPELRESENERVRKAIDEILKLDEAWQIAGNYGLTVVNIRKYLEKQKEPTTEELYAEAGTTEKEYIANTMKMVRAMRETKKEQKPMKWSEEDEKIRKQLINICNEWLGGGYSARPCLNDIRWLKNLLEKQKEPKHAPDDLQKSFEAGQTSIVDNPEQYGLCKKAKWSEEDEMLMDELESYILYDKEFNDEQKSWRIKRLKSLHPRPSWKPSEEQMKVFQNTMQRLLKAGGTGKWYAILESLYEDLKRL